MESAVGEFTKKEKSPTAVGLNRIGQIKIACEKNRPTKTIP